SGEKAAYDVAYGALVAVTYPWSLPFDRAEKEARVHLEHLGVAPAELLRVFAPPGADPAELKTEIACVSLDILPRERSLLTSALGLRASVLEAPRAARLVDRGSRQDPVHCARRRWRARLDRRRASREARTSRSRQGPAEPAHRRAPDALGLD